MIEPQKKETISASYSNRLRERPQDGAVKELEYICPITMAEEATSLGTVGSIQEGGRMPSSRDNLI